MDAKDSLQAEPMPRLISVRQTITVLVDGHFLENKEGDQPACAPVQSYKCLQRDDISCYNPSQQSFSHIGCFIVSKRKGHNMVPVVSLEQVALQILLLVIPDRHSLINDCLASRL